MSKRVQALSITGTIAYYQSLTGSSDSVSGSVPASGSASVETDCIGATGPADIHPDQFGIYSCRRLLLNQAPPIKSDHFILALCLEGSVRKQIGPFSFVVEPQHLYLVSPKYLHSFEEASADLKMHMVLFRKEFLADTYIKEPVLDDLLERDMEEAPLYKLSAADFATFKELFHSMEAEYMKGATYHIPILKLTLVRLLYELARMDEQRQHRVHPYHTHQSQVVHQYKTAVDQFFREQHTVQEYADHLHITAKHLSELVKKETGHTALSIIHQRLLQEALYLLHYSDMTMKEIGDLLGFTSPPHFTRFFKTQAGYSPSEVKKGAYAVAV
jgi:AraC family transcriptional activator of pobA